MQLAQKSGQLTRAAMLGSNLEVHDTLLKGIQMKIKVTCNPKRCSTLLFQTCVLMVVFLSACATTPREVYRGYSGADLPDTSLATVELGDADWMTINDQPHDLMRDLAQAWRAMNPESDKFRDGQQAASEQRALHIDGANYNAVTLLPGTYRIEYSARLAVNAFENPGMWMSLPKSAPATWVSRSISATVLLEAGRTYKLRADVANGTGYALYFWIEDSRGPVVTGKKKP